MAPAHPRPINYLLTTLEASRPQVHQPRETISTAAVDNFNFEARAVENPADSQQVFGLTVARLRIAAAPHLDGAGTSFSSWLARLDQELWLPKSPVAFRQIS